MVKEHVNARTPICQSDQMRYQSLVHCMIAFWRLGGRLLGRIGRDADRKLLKRCMVPFWRQVGCGLIMVYCNAVLQLLMQLVPGSVLHRVAAA